MKGRQVKVAPGRPLLILDGDCTFCRFWALRWQKSTRDAIDIIPARDPSVGQRFPELQDDLLQEAVHLIGTDGSVYTGAEAAFRALATVPHHLWLLDWYEHSPGFGRVSECLYRWIARHRPLAARLTWLGWGNVAEPSSYQLMRSVFLRGLGAVFLCAFLSLWVQIDSLVGQGGVLPAQITLALLKQPSAALSGNPVSFLNFPTLCWLSATDRSLHLQCVLGVICSVALLLGFAPAPCLFLLWLIYLSLATVCREFLSFQWDNLLLETGFIAMFFAPLTLWLRSSDSPAVSRLASFLIRLLLFRILFQSGWAQVLGDPAWRELTALKFHWLSQPLPNWGAWLAWHLPMWCQKAVTLSLLLIELAVPLLLCGPRRLRYGAFAVLVPFQFASLLTGNYGFLNFLLLVLCLSLLDDQILIRWLPARLRPGAAHGNGVFAGRAWPSKLVVPVACVAVAGSVMHFSATLRLRIPWPQPVRSLYSWLGPFRVVNSYGLFAGVPRSRKEIIIEGSMDGTSWAEYGFRYKPGFLDRRPVFVAPHLPRLAWQFWFATYGPSGQNIWVENLCYRLLQEKPEEAGLLEENPFPLKPPFLVRATLYEYRYTDLSTWRRTGMWWQRELKGPYIQPLRLGLMESSRGRSEIPKPKAPAGGRSRSRN